MFTVTTRDLTTDAIINIVSIAYGPGKWTRRKAFCIAINFIRQDLWYGDCYHEMVEE
jgi:hypothetical protein